MEQLVCKKCGAIDDYTTEQKSNNLVATCTCGAFIKNIPTEKPKFYFGKYKDNVIEDCNDLSYLIWARDNMNALKGRQKQAVLDRITSLTQMLR